MHVLTRQESQHTPAERLPLFRPEANGGRSPQLYGDIVLMRPVGLTVLLWAAIILFAAAGCVLAFGHYTSKTRVSGILLPDRGILRLYPSQPGILTESRARNGRTVHKGDILFLLASDRSTAKLRSVGAEARRELLVRRQSLFEERAASENLNAQQASDLQGRLGRLNEQQAALASEIRNAEAQLALDEEALERYRQLQGANLISVLDLRQKELAPLERQKTLAELRRSQIALDEERKDLYFQLRRLPLQLQMQNATVTRAISELEGELNEQEASHGSVVRAPADGTLSAVLDHTGMSVEANVALASLIPTGALLEAHLYAPSSAIGFIKPGQTALLAYRAYPSERFGRQLARLSEISHVALSPAEYAARTGAAAQEPMYEMVAKLPAQTLTVFGQSHQLWPGMEIEADILLERRNLIDWLVEPILAAKGRLMR